MFTRHGGIATTRERPLARLVALGAALAALLALAPVSAVSAGATAAPTNDDISGATAMGTLPYSNQQDSLTATVNPADPTPTCGAPNNFSVWYAFTSTSTGFLQATTGGGQGLAPTATASQVRPPRPQRTP